MVGSVNQWYLLGMGYSIPISIELQLSCVEEVYSLGNSRSLSRIKRNLMHLKNYAFLYTDCAKVSENNHRKYNFGARFTVPKVIDICFDI